MPHPNPNRLPQPRRRRGAALTEFAITVPLLVMIAFYSHFFVDVSVAKLKSVEAARFAAWEFAAWPLTDHEKSKHSDLFNSAKRTIEGEVKKRYDDTNPVFGRDKKGKRLTQPTAAQKRNRGKLLSLAIKDPKVTIRNNAMPFGMLIGMATGPLGLNNNGMIQAKFEYDIEDLNRWLPKQYLEARSRGPKGGRGFYNEASSPRRISSMEETVYLLVDSWAANDGQMHELNGSDMISPGKKNPPYYAVVDRIGGPMGAAANLQAGNNANQSLAQLNTALKAMKMAPQTALPGDPLTVKLGSKPYAGGSNNVNIPELENNGTKYTNKILEDQPLASFMNMLIPSPLAAKRNYNSTPIQAPGGQQTDHKVANKRGASHMGCKEAQKWPDRRKCHP